MTLEPMDLMRLSREIYHGQLGLRPHAWLVTVLRPLYAPFEEIYPWIPEGSRVVDVGCGTGAFLLLADRVRSLGPSVGYDVNEASVAVARSAQGSPTLRFETSEQIPDDVLASAEVVTLIDLLHHVPPKPRLDFLEHLGANMPQGARLVVKDLDTKPRWRAFANRITDYLSTGSRVDYLAMDELVERLEAMGFSIAFRWRQKKQVWSHYLVVADRL